MPKHGSAQRLPCRIRPAIVLFGDSITQEGFGVDGQVGWAGLLAAAYTRRADVLNRGFSGYQTTLALEMLPRIFPGHELGTRDDGNDDQGEDGHTLSSEQSTEASPSSASLPPILFCTIFFGANDSALPGERQHVPLEHYRSNLRQIVREIRQRTSVGNLKGAPDRAQEDCPIILLTPPPVDEEAWAKARDLTVSNRSNDAARAYGEVVQQVAQELPHCAALDTWNLLQGHDLQQRRPYLSDGLHLSEQGNRRLFQGLMDLIHERFPNLVPMSPDDGEGRYGGVGIPLEEKLWKELL